MATTEQNNDTQKQTSSESKLARPEQQRRPLAFTGPFALMGRVVDDLARIMDGFGPGIAPRTAFGPMRSAGFEAAWVPAIEAFERDGKLTVRAEVPGLAPEDVKVEIEDNTLVVSGERMQEREETRGDFYRSERGYGSFYRAIKLPDGVQLDQAQASFKNGVLEITLPLEQRSEAHSRQIPVRSEEGSAEQPQKTVNAQSSANPQASH